MKRVFIILVLFILCFTTVDAKTCSDREIINYSKQIDVFSYELKYAENAMDMNGDPLYNVFFMNNINVPNNWYLNITDTYNSLYADNNTAVQLNGGVYTFEIYNNECDNAIKQLNVFIPMYKNYCDSDNCNTDVWFDGTYESKQTSENNNINIKTIVSTKLIIVVVSLLLIIIISFVFIKSRHRKKLR